MFIRRHQNADGGGSPADGAGGNPPADGGAQPQGGAPADGGAGAGQGAVLDYKAEYEKLQADVKVKGETLGKQSNELGELRKLRKAMTGNRRGFVEEFAKASGLKIKFEDDANVNEENFLKKIQEGSSDEASAKEFLTSLKGGLKSDLMRELTPTLSVLQEQTYATKYKDWDGLSEQRDEVVVALASGQVSRDELLHYAVRGMRMSEAVNEARAKSFDDGRESVFKEIRASHSPAGAREQTPHGNNKTGGREYTENTVLPWLKARSETVKPK